MLLLWPLRFAPSHTALIQWVGPKDYPATSWTWISLSCICENNLNVYIIKLALWGTSSSVDNYYTHILTSWLHLSGFTLVQHTQSLLLDACEGASAVTRRAALETLAHMSAGWKQKGAALLYDICTKLCQTWISTPYGVCSMADHVLRLELFVSKCKTIISCSHKDWSCVPHMLMRTEPILQVHVHLLPRLWMLG